MLKENTHTQCKFESHVHRTKRIFYACNGKQHTNASDKINSINGYSAWLFVYHLSLALVNNIYKSRI